MPFSIDLRNVTVTLLNISEVEKPSSALEDGRYYSLFFKWKNREHRYVSMGVSALNQISVELKTNRTNFYWQWGIGMPHPVGLDPEEETIRKLTYKIMEIEKPAELLVYTYYREGIFTESKVSYIVELKG